MKVLVTGGGGFLGYHVARFLRKKKVETILLDLHPIDAHEYPGVSQVTLGDVRNARLMRELTKGIDVVVHAAAALPLAKDTEIESVTIQGTRNLLKASLANRVKRFIYISSTAVYGVPKIHPIVETAPLVGVGPYGNSKIIAEKLCRQYMNKGLSVTIIRPKTFVGSGRLGVFEILFDWVHDHKKIPLIGSGENRYQLLAVEDLVEAIWLFMQPTSLKLRGPGSYHDAFNIGALRFGTVKEDLEAFFSSVHSHSHVLPIPSVLVKTPLQVLEQLHLSPLYQWVYDTADKDSYVSIDKVMRALKWQPRYSNQESLTRAYQWYEKHYDEIKARGTGTTHTLGWKQGALAIAKRFM